MKIQLKNMKQINNMFNYQYQINDVKFNFFFEKTREHFIQQIRKIFNLKTK